MVLVALAVGAVTDRLTLSRDESKVLEFIDNIRNKQVPYPPSALHKKKALCQACAQSAGAVPCPALPVASIRGGEYGAARLPSGCFGTVSNDSVASVFGLRAVFDFRGHTPA